MTTVDCYKNNKTLSHVLRVTDLCREFIDAGVEVNERLLLSAAGLHDIAKEYGYKKHHKPKVIKKALRRKGIRVNPKVDIDDLCGIIANHRGRFEPDDYELEAAILRLCDKLDKFDGARLKAESIYHDARWEGKSRKNALRKSIETCTKKLNEAYISCQESLMNICEYFEELLDDFPELEPDFDMALVVFCRIYMRKINSSKRLSKELQTKRGVRFI